MQDSWVEMEHEGIEGTPRVLSSSFEKLHKRKGWTLVGEKKETVEKVPAKKAPAKKTVKKVETLDE